MGDGGAGRKVRKARRFNHLRCHTPPPGLAFGEPDDRLRRGIRYAAAVAVSHERLGVLDHPLSRVMTPVIEERPCNAVTSSVPASAMH
jgi:hypothetical protein